MPGKPVPMKPTKAWAAVDSKRGNVIMAHTDKVAVEWSCQRPLESGDVRLARVTLTEGDGWLPIETAPRTGDKKLLIVDRMGEQFCIYPACIQWGNNLTHLSPDGYRITHWQFAPEPPKARKK